jgi:uncharacterized protein YbjQ (UPF0145 family)
VVEFAFELFGPDRLMFGSDWPVAELGGGYVKMWTELSKLFDQLSPPGRAAGQGAHRAPDGRAFTSDLSAQDFFRLLAAGAVPVAFVLGTCVYHIAHQGVLQSLRQAGQNQEMLQFTQGVYEARELALARMQAEAAQARSSGIVGVSVEIANHVWGEHATEFLATGTAVRRLAEEHKLPDTSPRPTFTLGLDE